MKKIPALLLSLMLGFIGKGLTEDISLLDGSDFDALIDYLENEFPPALEELSERVSVPYEAGSNSERLLFANCSWVFYRGTPIRN